MAGKIKVKESEKLDDANIERVIALREQEKPVTIKEACEILNINANGARLNKIIQDYKDRKEEDKKRRAANRGKPAQDYEVSSIVQSYLAGESVKSIADSLYRSTDFVKRVVETVGIPEAQSGEVYFNPAMLPEQCVSEQFEVGEFVWASRYGALAEVIKHDGTASDGTNANVYQIYVYERIDPDQMSIDGKRYAVHYTEDNQLRKFGGRYAVQRAYDLGKLKHLKQYVSDFKRIIK